MAIANFPNGTKPTSMRITSETQTVVTHSQSFSRQARTRGGQRWKIEYTYPTMTRSQISPLLGFLQAQNGRAKEFEIDPATSLFSNTGVNQLSSSLVPVTSYESSSVGGGVVVKRAAGTVPFSSAIDSIEAGTFIKFSNHEKVYMTTQPLEISTSSNFHSTTITVGRTRDTNSPKLSGNILVSLVAINAAGTADDNAITTLSVITLAADTNSQVATKIVTAIDAIDGFSAAANGAVITISVTRKTGGATTADGRKIIAPYGLINYTASGITGIQFDTDQYADPGGSSTTAVLYFDPPLRKSIESTTDILVAPLDSVPFNVALVDDVWSININELELYNEFTVTFEETF